MDVYQSVTLSGGFASECQQEKNKVKVKAPPSPPPSSKLEEFFPGENMEEEDMNLQWLSIFVEDCLSSTTTYTTQSLLPPSQAPKPQPPQTLDLPPKFRTKRRRTTTPTHYLSEPPPLLHQAYWLAESELIFPVNTSMPSPPPAGPEPPPAAVEGERERERERVEGKLMAMVQQPKRCSHCLSQKTPQWRTGPLGPKTLCNACGVRFKSGRLLPEYRPAKSPTFESYKHSNSHKKVLEMRSTAAAIPTSPRSN